MSSVYLAPRDMASREPILSDDYALHYSNARAAGNFWRGWGRCWGYDPYLLAGFPRCALANADNKAWELVVLAFGPFVGPGRAFKLYIIAFLWLFPCLIYAASRNFEFSRGQSLGCAVLSFFLFYLSLPKDFVLWGMASYIVSCFCAIYVLSLFYRLMIAGFSWGIYCLTVACASLLFLNHILAPAHIVLPVAVLFVLFARKLPLKRTMAIAAVPCIVAAANLFWLVPVFDFLQDKTVIPEHYEFTLQITDLLEPLHVFGNQRRGLSHSVPVLNNTFIEVLLLLLGCVGCVQWLKTGRPRLAAAFGAGILCMFLVTFYGSRSAFLAQFQPQRFANAMNALLLVPAGAGLAACIKMVRTRSRFESMTLFALLFVVLYQPVLRPFVTIARHDFYRLTCRVPPPVDELLGFLEAHTTREGRILLEDSESINKHGQYEPEAYYGTHLPGLFPEMLRREYLCGPRPMYPVKHSFASFTRGTLFERPVWDYSAEELQRAFDLFNVRWIVCWFEQSRRFFDAMPSYVRPLGVVGKFAVYEVLREPSFFIKGRGTVRADYNRLELDDVRSEDNEIIIAYHWMKYLVSDCGAQIERVMVGSDPIGFIKIKNPPEKLTIYNAY